MMWTSQGSGPVSNVGSLIWDPQGSRLVLVTETGAVLTRIDTTWSTTSTPTSTTPNVPMAAYDPITKSVIAFGGFRDDGSAWTQVIATAAPPLRTKHGLAYDAQRRRIVLFGGSVLGPTGRRDTWDWDGVTWTERMPIVIVTPRISPVLTRDRTGGLLVAGGTNNNGPPLSDTWRLVYESATSPAEPCLDPTTDADGDGDAGCDDDDCWTRCTPPTTDVVLGLWAPLRRWGVRRDRGLRAVPAGLHGAVNDLSINQFFRTMPSRYRHL